ncbi:hypothetical protein CLOM_g15703 [Closterium sp. NIES-68]|nr:hypothetical protein CLOM_g15703 [Closterium sp. NIES-68]GJP77370.1 hypothetical protein CLOP_g7774 [Closterium sp. NIES-67]
MRVLLASPPVSPLQRVQTAQRVRASYTTLAFFHQIPRDSSPRRRSVGRSASYSWSVSSPSSTVAPLAISPLQDARLFDSDRSETAELSHQWRRFVSQLVAHRFLAAHGEVADSQPATAQQLDKKESPVAHTETPHTEGYVNQDIEAVVSGQATNEDVQPDLGSDLILDSALDSILSDKGEVKRAVLAVARCSPLLLSSFPLDDVRAIAAAGCPSTDRKVVNAAKRLRSLLSLSEATVCARCPLRKTCARAGKEIAPQEGYSFALPAVVPTGSEEGGAGSMITATKTGGDVTGNSRDVTDMATATSDVLRLAMGYALLAEAEAVASAVSHRPKAASPAASPSARVLVVAAAEVPRAATRRPAQPAPATIAVPASTASSSDWRGGRDSRDSRDGRRGGRGSRRETTGRDGSRDDRKEGSKESRGRYRDDGRTSSSSGGSSSSSSGTRVERWSRSEGLPRDRRSEGNASSNEKRGVWERRR